MLVRHLYQKSISEVLVRLLNVNENVFDSSDQVNYDEIRQNIIEKVVDRLDPKFEMEDHINAASLLSELADLKPIYTTLTN
jgi:hypothetical protein